MESTSKVRRNLPGTRGKDMFRWEYLPLEKTEGFFAMQEYLQKIIRDDPSNVKFIVSLPKNQDKAVWQVEHIRQIVQDLNVYLVALDPVCNKDTCPKMIARDEFLCATHGRKPKDCCAIDYMIHTISWATAQLNNEATFPSRIHIQPKALGTIGDLVRRLYRFLAHTYMHHRAVFDQLESSTFLCSRLVCFALTYKLMAKGQPVMTIPLEDLPIPLGNETEDSDTQQENAAEAE